MVCVLTSDGVASSWPVVSGEPHYLPVLLRLPTLPPLIALPGHVSVHNAHQCAHWVVKPVSTCRNTLAIVHSGQNGVACLSLGLLRGSLCIHVLNARVRAR